MKRRLFGVALLAWSGVVFGGEWMPLKNPPDGEIVGVRTTKVAGEIWANIVFSRMQHTGSISYNQSLTLYRFNCRLRTFSGLQADYYLNQASVAEAPSSPAVHYAVPGTVGGALVRYACKRGGFSLW